MDDDPAPRPRYTYPRLHIWRCASRGWLVWLYISESAPPKEKYKAESQEDAIIWMNITTHSEPTC